RDNPNDVPALYNLGLAVATQKRHAEAIAIYDQAVGADPLELSARTQAAMLRLTLCQWDGIPRYRSEIIEPALRHAQLARPPLPLETMRLAIPIAPSELHAIAVRSAHAHGLMARPSFRFAAPAPLAGRRLKIGYVSSDFGDLPVGYVMGGLLG